MISNLEIYRGAQATISRYEGGAALHAAQRADKLQRTVPEPGEGFH